MYSGSYRLQTGAPSIMESLLVLFSLISLGASQLTEVTLGPATATVSEGTTLIVSCTGNGAAPVYAGVTVALTVAAGTTAEDGYDADPIASFKCEIPAGASVGSVDIPINTDDVTDTDMYVIHGTVLAPVTMNAQMVTATITDVPGAGTMVKPVVEQMIEGSEAAGNVPVVVKFQDINGNPIPIEADARLDFTFVDGSATGGTTGAAPDDYNSTPQTANNLIAGTNGNGLLSATVMIPIIEDTLIENAERFSFTLTAVAGLDVDTTMVHTVTINDNDLPWISVLNGKTALPRKSKKVVTQVVFTDGPNNGITLGMTPSQTEPSTRNLNAALGVNGMRYLIGKPQPMSGQRITEYRWSTTETVGVSTYPLTAVSHVSATNHKSGKAPINVCAGSTITVYPAAFPSNGDLGEPVTIRAAATDTRDVSGLRWDFYNDVGPSASRVRLENNGQTSLTITKEREAGLYAISRLKRREKGWSQYVRVILSDCPKGRYHVTPMMCDGGPIVCQHGGIVDTAFGVCTCPPGYTGRLCQYPIAQGKFGPNGQFDLSDFFDDKNRGKGITFSFNYPFGSTCAAGFHGAGCDKTCKKGTFGAGCAFECRCVDDLCTPTGECPNGCRGGATGPTCQN